MNEENKLIEIFNSFNFSDDCRLIKVEYSSFFFGNFLLDIQCGFLQFRIINDRNQLFIEKYNKINMEWEDTGFTSIGVNSNNLEDALCNAFDYINSNK